MIKFYNGKTKDSLISSATLTQNNVANFVVDEGIMNDYDDNYFYVQMNWEHFLKMIRQTMVEEEQWMDPNYMEIDDDVVIYFPIDNNNVAFTSNNGMINLVPMMITTSEEDLITIQFANKYNIDNKYSIIPIIILFILIIGVIILSAYLVSKN